MYLCGEHENAEFWIERSKAPYKLHNHVVHLWMRTRLSKRLSLSILTGNASDDALIAEMEVSIFSS